MPMRIGMLSVIAWSICLCAIGLSQEEKGTEIALAGGKVKMTAPAKWKPQRPRVRIIQYEFAIPTAEKKDAANGRATFMTASGSVRQNIDRWISQFSQPDGKPTKERAKVEKKDIDGVAVYVVDLRGTYNDRRGPFAPANPKPGYRMLGAIIDTKSTGRHFVKFYGPEKTIAAHEKAFTAMLKTLKVSG